MESISNLDALQPIREVMQRMIAITEKELDWFLENAVVQSFPKNAVVHQAGKIPKQIFFINKGLIRVVVNDKEQMQHTLHFALERQFIADYTAFITQQPAAYTLEAIEASEVVVLSKQMIEDGYKQLKEGEKLGRLIAEFYFIYQDNRISKTYTSSPKERYDALADIFPGIHNRVPQHMIASYLGITPIHLSRLKRKR